MYESALRYEHGGGIMLYVLPSPPLQVRRDLIFQLPQLGRLRFVPTHRCRVRESLVAEGLELLLRLRVHAGVLLGIGQLLARRLLALVVGLALDLSPLLEPAVTRISLPSFTIPNNMPWCVSYLATTSWYFQPNS